MIGDIVPVKARTGCGARPLETLQILQKKWQARKGAVWQSLVYLSLGVILMLYDNGIDLRIDLDRPGNRLGE